MVISFIVINMVNTQDSLLFGCSAQLTSVIVSLPNALFQAIGKTLVSSIDKFVVHRELFGATGRAKTLTSVSWRGVGLLAILADPINKITLRNTLALVRAILSIPGWPGPKGFFTDWANLITHSRMSRTFIRAIPLALGIAGNKLFAAMFASLDAFALFANVSTAARTVTAQTSTKIMAVGFELLITNLASIKNWGLLFGCSGASVRAKSTICGDGFTAGGTSFHSTLPVERRPVLKKWGNRVQVLPVFQAGS